MVTEEWLGFLIGVVLGGAAGALFIGGPLGYENACRQAGAVVVRVADGTNRCLPVDKAEKVKAALKAAEESAK